LAYEIGAADPMRAAADLIRADDPRRRENADGGSDGEHHDGDAVDGVGRPGVVAFERLHEQWDECRGEDPSEEQLVHDVRSGVRDVVDVGDRAETERDERGDPQEARDAREQCAEPDDRAGPRDTSRWF